MQMTQSFVYLQVNFKLRHDFVNFGVLEHDLPMAVTLQHRL